MSKVKIELNHDAMRDLLRSKGAVKACENEMKKARAKLGEGYEVTTYVGESRCNASIKAVSKKAKQENLKNNTILKAVCGK